MDTSDSTAVPKPVSWQDYENERTAILREEVTRAQAERDAVAVIRQREREERDAHRAEMAAYRKWSTEVVNEQTELLKGIYRKLVLILDNMPPK